jgi:hypothetical protein
VTAPEQTTDLRDLAAEAAVDGFALVFNLSQVDRFTQHGLGAIPPAPFNAFTHASQLAGPDDTFVSINNDTVYSAAQLDLSAGPLRLDVPDTDGRYYVLQFVDAWTNNFAYVGRRATGTGAGSYWLVPPGGDDAAPDGATTIHVPTAVATIVGRLAVDGDEDLPAVHALQAGLRLTPGGDAAEPRGLPDPDPRVAEDLLFFERFRVLAQAFPPAPAEQQHLRRYAPLGLLDADSPYAEPDPELAAALRDGLAAGRERIERTIENPAVPVQNGWRTSYHAFDYNDDIFEVGTIDSPEWRIADRDAARLIRAASARGGLWGNHGYEAAYAMTYVDGDGEPLSGDRAYTIRFDEEPPVGAFWSITMYDLPEFYLVANPIGRYSIGDRTRGLRRAGDGSLTIVIQHDDPGGDEHANWLPAPPGRFRPILRMYEPREAVFDGTFVIPPIERRA